MSLETIEVDRSAVLGRVRALGWPVETITDRPLGNQTVWSDFIGNANRLQLEEIDRRLQPREARAARDRAWSDHFEAERAAGNAPQTEDEQAQAAQTIREANERAAERASAVGRLEAIEGLLTQIRDQLATRR